MLRKQLAALMVGLGLAVATNVAPANVAPVAAQGGGELAEACQDPDFREDINELVDSFFGIDIDISSVGERVSAFQTLLLNDTNSSRFITLVCEDPDLAAELGGNRGRCIAILSSVLKRQAPTGPADQRPPARTRRRGPHEEWHR